MKTKVIAIFDIGKTNKKFFLFDSNLQEVYKENIFLEEIKDEDNYPTENLNELVEWIKNVFERAFNLKQFEITALNFSAYGASLVYLDKDGKVLSPLYNYTKPIDKKIINKFYQKHGNNNLINHSTASPQLEMLNSGMQLFWLKYTKKTLFKKVKYALHFPQYLSYLFTQKTLSEYTSIGCHTMMWDYKKKDYHQWIYKEKINTILPKIVNTITTTNIIYKNKIIKVGVGIHDSSAALLTYLKIIKTPFILISTGTWSVSLNPFSIKYLTQKNIKNNCVNFMKIDGETVKASRIFLGNEYNIQIAKITKYFKVTLNDIHNLKWNKNLFLKIYKKYKPIYNFETISQNIKPNTNDIWLNFQNLEHAYYQLLIELVKHQILSTNTILDNNNKINNFYIDGGFSTNKIFKKILSYLLPNINIYSSKNALGSSLGAAICIENNIILNKITKFIKE